VRDYNLLKNKFLKDHRHAEVSSLFSTPRADVNLQAYLLHDLVIFCLSNWTCQQTEH